MPTSVSEPDALVDTSVAVALVVEAHEHHRATVDAIGRRNLGLAGHATFETFSVLTRLPPPARRSPAEVLRLLAANFPANRYLSGGGAETLLSKLPQVGVAGGSVYDALVGAAAAESGLPLLTRDRRAVPIYLALDVNVELLDS